MRAVYIVCTLIVLLATAAFGQTGKIEGVVAQSGTGEKLVGVNIVVEGTFLGAATNLEGIYTILNVPPGAHTVRASMIGYDPVTVLDVRVNINQTTRIDIELHESAFELEEVVVVAQRPIVERDVSASQMIIEAATIQNLPVQNVDQVLTLQAGIERGSEGIIIRGGAANQTIFLVDGLSLNDERSNLPYTAVSLSSLQEIHIQTGGFNAEYGNVRSGIVNVVTREGSRQRYNASAMVYYSPATAKHFGPSLYDPYSYFNRPYMDPDVAWTGTRNGAWDDYTQRQYPTFEGWNSVSERSMQDGNPATDLTPEGAKRLYEWYRRRQGDIKKPDYVIDIGIGGPLPMLGQQLGDLRFFLTHFSEREMFIYPLSRDSYFDSHTQLKLTSNLTPSVKLNVTGLYGEVHSVSPYDWTTTPTGRVLRDQYEVANLLNSTNGSSILYMPGYFSPSSIFRTMVGFKLTHTISSKTFYDVSLQYNVNKYKTYQLAERDTARIFEPIPGYFVDESPFGYDGYGSSAIDGMSMGGWMNLGRDRSVNTTTALRFDITSQINRSNQVKAGVSLVYNDYRIRSSTFSPSMSTWTRDMIYDVFPYRIGAYVQDKLEFGGFIANVGARLDYSDPNAERFALDPYSIYLKAGYGNRIEEEVETESSDPMWSLSPRLGISHPITDNSKLYFNYGHFRSEPSSSTRFRLQRESSGLVTYLGEPNLELEKTVAYELGYSQNLFDMLLLNLAAYYKDITQQPGWVFYQNFDNSVQYYRATNNNYADIRGFEVTLTKQSGRLLTGFINYTYDVRTSGFFGLQRYYQDTKAQRDYLRNNPYQTRPHPRPYARANINVRTPDDFGPSLAGLHVFGSLNIGFLADWRSGLRETYNPNNIPGIVDNVQWRDFYNIDVRLSKEFRIISYSAVFYLDITNVFNLKYLSRTGFADGFDFQSYLESLRFPWKEGVMKGDDKLGDYRPANVAYDPLEHNPTNDPDISRRNDERINNKSYIDNPNIESLMFLNPRRYTFGFRINL